MSLNIQGGYYYLIMKKTISKLGKPLHKARQQQITGGISKPCNKYCVKPIGECINGLCYLIDTISYIA